MGRRAGDVAAAAVVYPSRVHVAQRGGVGREQLVGDGAAVEDDVKVGAARRDVAVVFCHAERFKVHRGGHEGAESYENVRVRRDVTGSLHTDAQGATKVAGANAVDPVVGHQLVDCGLCHLPQHADARLHIMVRCRWGESCCLKDLHFFWLFWIG